MEYNLIYDNRDNAYTTTVNPLTGDCILRVEFSGRGRVAIRKSNNGIAPWPIVLMSPPSESVEIYIFGRTKGKSIKIQTSQMPAKCELYKV